MTNEIKGMQADVLFAKGIFYKIVGAHLKDRREALQWTQSELARNADLGLTVIRNLEDGKPSSLETITLVASTIEISPKEFMPEHSGVIVQPSLPDRRRLLADYRRIFRNSAVFQQPIEQLEAFIQSLDQASGLPKQEDQPSEPDRRQYALYRPQSREEILASFGRRIEICRVLQGLSSSQLATRCNISLTSFMLLEAGLRNPSLETIYKIAQGAKVSVFFFMPGQHDDLKHLQLLDLLSLTVSCQQASREIALMHNVLRQIAESVYAPVSDD